MRYGHLLIRPFRGRMSEKNLHRIAKEMIRELHFGRHIATGKMIRRIHVWGNGVVVEVPYAVFLNYGTRPHLAPLKPLIVWARAKFGADDQTAKRIAYFVRRKIAFRGTKPVLFIEHVLDRLGYEIVDRFFEGGYTVIWIRRKRRRR